MPLNRVTLIALTALLTAAQVAAKGEVETVEGCEVRFLRPKFVTDYAAKVSWSGACNKKGIAEGSGVLYFVDKDGDWGRYSGTLVDGWASGAGDYRMNNGTRRVGTFSGNQFSEGRMYEANGRLLFEGRFLDGAIDEGSYWIRDDLVARGKFEPGAKSVGDGGTGIVHAAIIDAAGAVKHWLVGTTRYTTLADYERATTAYLGQLAAQRQAAYEAEQARLEVERQRQAAEADRTYQAVAGALLGAAQAYNQQQIAALGGYQAPAPVYTPPAPVYQAPAYKPPAPVYTPPAPAYTPPPAAAPSLPMQMNIEMAQGCARYEYVARTAPGYAKYGFTNLCHYTINVGSEFFINNQLSDYDGMQAFVNPGQTVWKEVRAETATSRWHVSQTYACPGRDEIARRTGRRVAGVYFQKGRGCWALFESTGVGTGN